MLDARNSDGLMPGAGLDGFAQAGKGSGEHLVCSNQVGPYAVYAGAAQIRRGKTKARKKCSRVIAVPGAVAIVLAIACFAAGHRTIYSADTQRSDVNFRICRVGAPRH